MRLDHPFVRCWSEAQRSYVQSAGSASLDAAEILCVRRGYAEEIDPTGAEFSATSRMGSRTCRLSPHRWRSRTRSPDQRAAGAPFTWIFLVFLAGASDRVFVALGISYVGRSGSTA